MPRFTNKTVIVTGAGSGIGAATARRFSSEGANVVLIGRTRDTLEDVASDLPEERTLVFVADVSQAGDINAAMAATVEKFGGLDTLVNNAGIARPGNVEALAYEDFEKQMAVNIGGVFLACKAAMPHLKQSKGSIVSISSVSGTGGDWGMAGYGASKGAVTNMSRNMALDHARDGVRVNAVAPSLTDTEMASFVLSNDGMMQEFMKRIPMGRAGQPEDVADAIAFLASDDARFVTGVNLPVDGGLSASNGQPALG